MNRFTVKLIKIYFNTIKLGENFLWDQKIKPVKQVQLLNQVLLYQKKLTLKKPKEFWVLGIIVAKSEMLLNQVPIQLYTVQLKD